MYKVGIIGCGWIGCEAPDNHLSAYKTCSETQVRGLSDIDLKKVNKHTNKVLSEVAYTNYFTMVKRHRLDIVSVCTPPETHCQIVCDIAPYVKAIYLEKPIALTLEDADKIIDICHKYGVILQVNHQRLFMKPKFRFSRGIIHTGTHVFSLIDHLFKVDVDVEYIDTDERIFELECLHTKEPMILKGVEHLVECLKEGKESVSSGESAREALRKCLEYEKLFTSGN